MTGAGHFVEAERLLEAAELMDLMDPTRADYIGRANAHASLAAAAASAEQYLDRDRPRFADASWSAALR
jgi:hypothetical protein